MAAMLFHIAIVGRARCAICVYTNTFIGMHPMSFTGYGFGHFATVFVEILYPFGSWLIFNILNRQLYILCMHSNLFIAHLFSHVYICVPHGLCISSIFTAKYYHKCLCRTSKKYKWNCLQFNDTSISLPLSELHRAATIIISTIFLWDACHMYVFTPIHILQYVNIFWYWLHDSDHNTRINKKGY